MFDLSSYEPRRHAAPVVPESPAPPPADIRRLALLHWCEHCVECAAPACYRSCDLFQARRDGHCRLLDFGMYANRRFQGPHGFGAEMSFRRWGKLEAQGSLRMLPRAGLLRWERAITAAARLLDAAGRMVGRWTGNLRWTRPTQALLARVARRWSAPAAVEPTGFLLEAYNPAAGDAVLQLAMRRDPYTLPAGDARTPPFQATLCLPPGFSRHFFEWPRFRRVTAAGPFLVSLAPLPDTTPRLVLLAADFVVAPALLPLAKPVKCVVWDLDGTLWDGVLLEPGAVRLRPHVPALLESLDRRGILLSVASKNDYGAAWEKLEEFGLAEYFLEPQIGWNPKSDALRQIAGRLNLGLDSFAFIDDSPFERAEVTSALPEVAAIDAAEAVRLPDDPRFQGGATEEARHRRQYYRAALAREREQGQAAGDCTAFLAACEIRLEVADYQPAGFDRVAELLQRTNQLNFSGRHYSREDVRRLVDDAGCSRLVLRCRDRYGDYGTVGFGIVRRAAEEIVVEDFMLSCRVQAKYIEQAFFAGLRAQAGNPLPLVVRYRESGRNKPAGAVLRSMCFQPAEGGGMRLDPRQPLACDFIHVDWTAGAQAEPALEIP